MRLIIFILPVLALFGCGTDFYLNHEPMKQVVTLTQGDKSLSVQGKAVIMDNTVRMRVESEFYNGYADIILDKGDYSINYRNLPMDNSTAESLKGDIYAAFFAGGYPYKNDHTMFGETSMRYREKTVQDTDGYKLYRVVYNGREIRVFNLIRDYSVHILSDRVIGD
jgi:hypothetical protein